MCSLTKRHFAWAKAGKKKVFKRAGSSSFALEQGGSVIISVNIESDWLDCELNVLNKKIKLFLLQYPEIQLRRTTLHEVD